MGGDFFILIVQGFKDDQCFPSGFRGVEGKFYIHGSFRVFRGLTQEKLAEIVNISSTYLSAVERNTKYPKLETFIRIANAIGASTDDLLQDVLEIRQHEEYIKREERIRKLPLKDRNMIYKVLDVMLEEAEQN